MTDLAQFLRSRYTKQRNLAEQACPGPWRVNPDDPDEVLASDGIVAAEAFALSGNQLRNTALFIAAHDPAHVLADLDAKLAVVDEIEPPAIVELEPTEPETGWCCGGFVSECPLCPEYGTSLVTPCPGHPGSGANKSRVVGARLHARFAYPSYEYRTTEGPRKQWDGIDRPPAGDTDDPDPTWERNVDAGYPGTGWERFDCTEESYWRRPRFTAQQPQLPPRILRLLAQPFAGHPEFKEEWTA